MTLSIHSNNDLGTALGTPLFIVVVLTMVNGLKRTIYWHLFAISGVHAIRCTLVKIID